MNNRQQAEELRSSQDSLNQQKEKMAQLLVQLNDAKKQLDIKGHEMIAFRKESENRLRYGLATRLTLFMTVTIMNSNTYDKLKLIFSIDFVSKNLYQCITLKSRQPNQITDTSRSYY